jgi:hypothetical protein
MILRSEGEKLKFCQSPERDRKYVIAAFTNLVCEKTGLFLDDSLKTVISGLMDLSS